MKCSKCKKDNKEGAQVCEFCGEKLATLSESLDSTGNNKSAEDKRDMDFEPIRPKRSMGGDEKTIVAIAGCALILISGVVVASYFLFKSLLASVPDWWQDLTTSGTATQPSENFQALDESEILFYGIRNQAQYRPFQTIGMMYLDSLNEKTLVRESGGVFPIWVSPEAGQSFISPDRKTIAMVSGYAQGDLFIYHVGDITPLFEWGGYSSYERFHSFSADGKYFSFSGRDPATYELNLNILDLEIKEVYQFPRLILGLFIPDSEEMIVFRMNESEDKIIAIERLDLMSERVTTLFELDLIYDEIGYITPFLSTNGDLVFYVDGDELMSLCIESGENKSIYSFEFDYEAWAFPLHRSDKIVIVDGSDPDIANLYLYNPQNNQMSRIDQSVSTTVFHYDQRSFANVPSVVLSPDAKQIAYPGGQIGVMELRITELDGGATIPLSNRVDFISFKFSPDNQHLAYIEFDESWHYGELFITDRYGQIKQRLDSDVISFEFVSNGESIIYSRYEDPLKETPVSTVYRVDINGGGKVHLANADGTFVFIHLP